VSKYLAFKRFSAEPKRLTVWGTGRGFLQWTEGGWRGLFHPNITNYTFSKPLLLAFLLCKMRIITAASYDCCNDKEEYL
jgi:hypothetical protein